jgi:adenosylmethionine-8-amino-7-oxononanoate aminotransferase
MTIEFRKATGRVTMSTESSHVLYRNLRKPYTTIARGTGVTLWDNNGKEYLDAVGGVAVNVIGHGVPEITDAIAKAGATTTFSYAAVFTNPWQEELAANIASISPIPDSKVFFTSGGSEANESAIKLARQYHIERGQPQRWKVISRWQSYHGNTLGTLAISGRPSWRIPYDPYLVVAPHIVPPYCYRCPFEKTYPTCGVECADDLERTILQEGADTISAFIAEPVVGTSLAGVVPVPEYYARIREICDRYGILFIADEVLTGYGRTGKAFSIDHWGIIPDIITVGKGVGSGYTPIAACIADPKIVDVLRKGSGRFLHGFTYGGMSLACFIGVQVFDYIAKHDLFARSAEQGAYLHEQLHAMAVSRPAIGNVRGLGLFAGVELVADRDTKAPFDKSLAVTDRIVAVAETKGLLLREGSPDANYGKGGDQVQISPPYVITREEIDRLVDLLGQSIDEVVG